RFHETRPFSLLRICARGKHGGRPLMVFDGASPHARDSVPKFRAVILSRRRITTPKESNQFQDCVRKSCVARLISARLWFWDSWILPLVVGGSWGHGPPSSRLGPGSPMPLALPEQERFADRKPSADGAGIPGTCRLAADARHKNDPLR